MWSAQPVFAQTNELPGAKLSSVMQVTPALKSRKRRTSLSVASHTECGRPASQVSEICRIGRDHHSNCKVRSVFGSR